LTANDIASLHGVVLTGGKSKFRSRACQLRPACCELRNSSQVGR
jgi:hypothetical protein